MRNSGCRPDGEKEARRLVDVYADMILRTSYTCLNSTADAEGICQEVLLRVLAKAPHFESPKLERAWIIHVTVNACMDLMKSGARSRCIALEAAEELKALEAPDGTVADAVAHLPRDQREAFYLHYYEGFDIAGIALAVGASKTAIAKRLSRARRALRRMLGDKNERS